MGTEKFEFRVTDSKTARISQISFFVFCLSLRFYISFELLQEGLLVAFDFFVGVSGVHLNTQRLAGAFGKLFAFDHGDQFLFLRLVSLRDDTKLLHVLVKWPHTDPKQTTIQLHFIR